MRINGNPIFNTTRNLYHADNIVNKTLERVTSSKSINHASDDAAGLSIGIKLKSRVAGGYSTC